MAAKKNNTMLWVLGFAGVGAIAYFAFIRPKQTTGQKQLGGTISAEAEIAKAKAAEARARADEAKAKAEGRLTLGEQFLLGIPDMIIGFGEVWG